MGYAVSGRISDKQQAFPRTRVPNPESRIPSFIDSHTHLQDPAFDPDRTEAIERARAAGVSTMILAGSDPADSAAGLALAKATNGLYIAAGIAPHASGSGIADLPKIEPFLADSCIVAIGEIGLDYHWNVHPREDQKNLLRRQMAMAREAGLPVILHDRQAHEDLLDVVEACEGTLRGVVHCFSGGLEMARRVAAAGFMLGFGGPLAYPANEGLHRIAASLPRDAVLLETDAPYLAPPPYRGERNEPAYLVETARALAGIWDCTLEETGRITAENAERLFGLDRIRE